MGRDARPQTLVREEFFKARDILPVLVEVFGFRGFERHRVVLEGSTPHQIAEDIETKSSLSDMLMAVATTSEGFLGVIEMKNLEVLKTSDGIKVFKDFSTARFASNVIPCGVSMTGIETESDTLCFFHP